MYARPSTSVTYEPDASAIATGSRRGYVLALDSFASWLASKARPFGPGTERSDSASDAAALSMVMTGYLQLIPGRQGVHLSRVPGPAGCRPPATARRSHRADRGQPHRPPQ